MKKFFRRLLSGEFKNRTIFLSFLLLGLVIYSPYITSPFYYDDFFFFSAIEQNYKYNEFIGFWAARVEDSPSFKAIWWQDSDADVKFLRPVPAFVISKCIKIFSRGAPLPLHLLSIILHSVIAFTVFLLFNKLSGKYAVSLTAGFLYLICIHFSGTIGWISAMTDIIAVLFMNLSLYYYVRKRVSKNKADIFLSAFFLIIALLCKETAVIAPLAILLYELIINNNRTQHSVKGEIKSFFLKWRSWSFSFIILVLFLVIYKLGGFGARSALYYSPFSEPLTYLSKSLVGFPMLILPYLTLFPTSLSTFMPELLKPTAIAGYIMFLILFVSLIPYRKDKVLQFSFLLLLISLFPQFSTDASERQLYYPYVAGSFIISFLIFQLKFLKKYSPDTPPRIKYLGTAFGIYLLISSLALSFIISFRYPYSFSISMDNPQGFVMASKKIIDQKNPSKIIYLNTTGPFITLYVNDVFWYYTGVYKDINILSGFNGEIWMKKLSDSSFEMKTDSKGWLSNMFAKVLRSGPLVEKGRVYSRKDFNAVILKTTADNKDALEVRFDFKYNLTSPGVLILYYNDSEVKAWNFKLQETGKWVLVGNTSDVMKSLFE